MFLVLGLQPIVALSILAVIGSVLVFLGRDRGKGPNRALQYPGFALLAVSFGVTLPLLYRAVFRRSTPDAGFDADATVVPDPAASPAPAPAPSSPAPSPAPSSPAPAPAPAATPSLMPATPATPSMLFPVAPAAK